MIEIAQAWWRLSHLERERVRGINPKLAELLDEADKNTRGLLARCVCTSAPHHDMRCPARPLS